MGEPQKPAVRPAVPLAQEDLRRLSQLYGLTIGEEDLNEVALRLGALLDEVQKLDQLDLSQVEPIALFLPEEGS